MMNFKQFDRLFEDFRDDVAKASLVRGEAIKRYVAMLNALDTAFMLYYGDLPEGEKMALMAAFNKLRETVNLFVESPPDNVTMLKRATVVNKARPPKIT